VREDEAGAMDLLQRLLGYPEMARNGGLWTVRYRESRRAFQVAYDSTKLKRDELRRDAKPWKTSAASYMTKCYRNELRRSHGQTALKTIPLPAEARS
jgi:hypothetical protein